MFVYDKKEYLGDFIETLGDFARTLGVFIIILREFGLELYDFIWVCWTELLLPIELDGLQLGASSPDVQCERFLSLG